MIFLYFYAFLLYDRTEVILLAPPYDLILLWISISFC